jgi:prophage antirepressor-like protein
VSKLALATSESFNGVICDFYRQGDEVLMTREQIGQALEYADPMVAIAKIHDRHADRLEGLSFTRTVNGHKTYFYSAKGIYEVCRWSNQPKANAFYDFVYDMLEALRKGEAVLLLSRQIRRELTDAIEDSGENKRMHGYAHKHYTDLAYKHVFGKSAAQIRMERGLPSDANVREHLTEEERLMVAKCEHAIESFLALGYGYEEIKRFLDGNKALSA